MRARPDNNAASPEKPGPQAATMSLSWTRGKASGGSVFLQQKRFIGWDDK